MAVQVPVGTRVTFGLFEADLQSGELWKAGRKVKLQSQPFRALALLVQRPGELISREELQEHLWGKHVAGDFDQSLGTAINKVREALGDSADSPRYVETLARRGYRFIAPVSVPHPPLAEDGWIEHDPKPIAALPPAPVLTPAPASAPASVSVPARRSFPWLVACGALVLAALATGAGYWAGSRETSAVPRIDRVTHWGRIAPGIQSFESLPASVTDGLRIFTSVIANGRSALAQVDAHTGAMQHIALPAEIPSPMLGDLSPDGSSLLLRSHLTPESEQPLWMVPTAGGSALRVANVVAHDATWMPDGKDVLYAEGDRLIVHHLADDTATPFATLPGRVFWMRWSPDGTLLRFTLLNPVDHTVSLWQVGRDGKGAGPILNGWSRPPSECCGSWTGDGKYFIFQANASGSSDLWRLSGKSAGSPVRITNGPLSFVAPMTARAGHRIYFLGLEAQSALLQLDPRRKAFVPAPEFMATANRIEYSRDRQWVIWTDQQGHLWRAHADGTERIQVTPALLEVFLARWSPDGSKIALMAREPGKAWQIFTIPPDGGTPRPLLPETRNQADPSWSADGQQIVFGRVTDIMGKEDGVRALELLDLKTGTVSMVPGSNGLFSPRWSPEGRYIAAISLDQRRLMLLDLQTQAWSTLSDASVADPVWSWDSKSIFFHAAQAAGQPLYRAAIAGGPLEQIVTLADFANGATEDFFFCGLDPAGNPLIRSRMRTGDVYTLDLDSH